MITTLELAAGAVRLCRIEEQRITALESWPVPPGGDPLVVLEAAALPERLGRVGVLLAHDDLLIRTVVQPAGPKDRQDRLIRCELDAVAPSPDHADHTGPEMAIAWQAIPAPTEDLDHRVLALLVRQRLLERIRTTLGKRGVLTSVSHPGLGLYQAFIRLEPNHQGCCVLLDIGGQSVHIAVVVDGALAFLRTLHPGTDDLPVHLTKLRGISLGEAEELVRRIAPGSPQDLHDLVTGQAGTIAAQTTAAVRFARTQLGLALEPTVIHVSGRGALTFGFIQALAKRSQLPVRILNPFSGVIAFLPEEKLDALAALPGPWAPLIGGALHPDAWGLDALADERQARATHRRTVGALRWGAAAGVLLALGGAGLAFGRAQGAAQSRGEFEQRQKDAQTLAERRTAATTAWQQAAARLAWLDGERRVPRISVEVITAITGLQDPGTCPVVLNKLSLIRQGAATQLELTGAATAGRVGADAALHTFHDGLRKQYPLLASSDLRPTTIAADRLEFRLNGTMADR